jgi:NHS family xanthosine MFS transporter
MPTISLSISLAYTALKNNHFDIVKIYPPIRVWGTVGFIAALWTVNLLSFGTSANQFYLASISSLCLGIYAFTLPNCPPNKTIQAKGFMASLGLNAFKLFKDSKMAMFFIFAMFLGASLQLTNAYGDTYLLDFAKNELYQDSFVVKYSQIIMSISQISETLFILTIPFFLKRFGIKQVMLFSMIAWVLRFALFAYGNPTDGLWMIIASCIIYGMAFDFFNISGSLFVETQSDPTIRASVQGLFMMMVNGVGAVIGSLSSGFIIQSYFTNTDKSLDWQGIWTSFAIYSAIITILFALSFKHKHDSKEIEHVTH